DRTADAIEVIFYPIPFGPDVLDLLVVVLPAQFPPKGGEIRIGRPIGHVSCRQRARELFPSNPNLVGIILAEQRSGLRQRNASECGRLVGPWHWTSNSDAGVRPVGAFQPSHRPLD